jgi:hypothetical protein
MFAEFGGWRGVFRSKDIQCFELGSIRGSRGADGVYQSLLQFSLVEILHFADREYANVERVMADDLRD